MPIDYKKYPDNWKTVIRPDILKRAGNKCEFCGVPNGVIICRGNWDGIPAWQNDDGQIFNAENGEYMGESYVGDVWNKKQILTKVVLTIAHLDHDVSNNHYDNLKALCQRCHLKHDKPQHMKSAKETIEKKKGLLTLF